LFEARDLDALRAEVAAWLVSFCDPVTAGDDGGLAFGVQDGGALGLPGLDLGDACGFHLHEDDDVLADHDDLSEPPRVPVQGLLVDADCSGPVNHRLLGHLALARRHDAWVGFGGLPGCTHPPEETDAASKAPAQALAGLLDHGHGGRPGFGGDESFARRP
jgi:hypothetical protein